MSCFWCTTSTSWGSNACSLHRVYTPAPCLVVTSGHAVTVMCRINALSSYLNLHYCFMLLHQKRIMFKNIGPRSCVYHTLPLLIQNPVEKQPGSRIPKNVKDMKINPNWMVTHTSLLKVSIQTNKLKAKNICVNLISLSVINTRKIYHKITLP